MKKRSLPCYLALAFLLAGCGANSGAETPIVNVDVTATILVKVILKQHITLAIHLLDQQLLQLIAMDQKKMLLHI